jgi:hypothetical protein
MPRVKAPYQEENYFRVNTKRYHEEILHADMGHAEDQYDEETKLRKQIDIPS